jgi:outer membrane receptor for ferrienterochelin and colicins
MNCHTCASLIAIDFCCSLLRPVINRIKSVCFIKPGIVLLVFLPAIAAAQSSTEKTSEPPIQEIAVSELVQILEVETDIATRSRLNVDFVPGMVTVLNGDDLQARGIRNVWEALSLVPGFQLTIEPVGNKEISVRGLESTFASGTNKYLVNGVAINTTLTGSVAHIQEIPIAQVDRIEVIRGPGSAVHGEYAYTSVVHVITKSQNKVVFGAVEKFDTYRLGGMYSWSDSEKDLRGSINVAALDSNGADIDSGLDKLYSMGQGGISNAPGPTNEALETRTLFFNLGYKDFTVVAQYLKHGLGDHFGSNDVLPFPETRIAVEHENIGLELKQVLHINNQLESELKLGWLDYLIEGDEVLVNPPGFAGTYPDGMIGSPYYEESQLNFDINFTWTGIKNNKIYGEWAFAKTTMGDTWQVTNYVPSTLQPLPSPQRFSGSENFIEEDQSRTLNSLVIQDEYTPNRATTITLGLRYDHYDDIGDSVTPRLAGVWRLDNNNILKAQYASAFRPPTFLEMYSQNNTVVTGNSDIKAQTSDNYELGYIYRRPGQVYHVTLFRSDLKDVIVLENGMYSNSGGARLTGIEAEAQHEFIRELKLDANISYTDTEDLDTGEPIPNVSGWLFNIGLLYEPVKYLIFGIQYQCVCDYVRASGDPRPELEGHQTFDITVSSFNTWYKGFTIRAGIKNLFSDEVKYPSLPNTYPDDYPRPGRSWWMELSQDF